MGHGIAQAKVTGVKNLCSGQARPPMSHQPVVAALRLSRRLTSACTRPATRGMSSTLIGAGGRVMRGVMRPYNRRLMKRWCLRMLALVAAFIWLPMTAYAQSSEPLAPIDDPPEVVSAVAPFYPNIWPPHTTGSIMVEVTIDAQGGVTTAKALNGHPLLHGASVAAAKMWRFVAAPEGSGDRVARLTFAYRVAPAGTAEDEFWPVYRPPYGVEVKRLEVKTRGSRRR
jgi:hypothetical protein